MFRRDHEQDHENDDVSRGLDQQRAVLNFTMVFPRRESLFLALVVLGLSVVRPGEVHAETLPDRQPALIGP